MTTNELYEQAQEERKAGHILRSDTLVHRTQIAWNVSNRAEQIVAKASYLIRELGRLRDEVQEGKEILEGPVGGMDTFHDQYGASTFGVSNTLGVVQGSGSDLDRLCGEIGQLFETDKLLANCISRDSSAS